MIEPSTSVRRGWCCVCKEEGKKQKIKSGGKACVGSGRIELGLVRRLDWVRPRVGRTSPPAAHGIGAAMGWRTPLLNPMTASGLPARIAS
jgi:hypothetical protein